MRTYFDSSVLVPAILEVLPDHEAALAAIERSGRHPGRGLTSTHALAEAWAVATALPLRPRPSPELVMECIRGFVAGSLGIVPLDEGDYIAAMEAATARGLRSGIVYDALHLRAARKARADLILTRDTADFRRLAPDLADRIRSP